MNERVGPSSVHRIAPWRVFGAAFVWPMCCAGLVSIAFWRLFDRLPEPIASHWGPSGPDGSMSRAAFFSLTVGIGALIATTGLVAALATGHFFAERVAMVAGSGVATFFGGMALTSLWANLDAASWTDARPLGAATVGGVVVASFLVGVGAWQVAGRPPATPPEHEPWTGRAVLPTPDGASPDGASPGGPSPDVAVPDRAVPDWNGGCRVAWPIWLALSLTVIGASAVLAVPDRLGRVWLGSLFLVSVLACAATARVAVTVSPDGLRISFSALAWPVRRVAPDQIVSVEVIELDPLQWGGWGYRWVPHRHATAVVLRRGEAIVLHLSGGRTLAVTVDDAAGCELAVEALIRAHRTPR